MSREAILPVSFIEMQRCKASDHFLPHAHDFYELNYITSGSTRLRLNDLVLACEVNDFVLVPPKQKHSFFYSQEQSYGSNELHFVCDRGFMQGVCEDHQVLKLHDYDGAVQFLCSEIFRLQRNYQDDDQDLFNAYLYAVLLHMRRGTVLEVADSSAPADDQVERAVQYINDNILAAPVTVSSVAEELGLSPAYFARLFQRRMGIAPVKYIIKVKMAQAKRMLTEGNYSIKEIAAALHYENQLYFSRQFTRDVGIPPRQYRAETRSKS